MNHKLHKSIYLVIFLSLLGAALQAWFGDSGHSLSCHSIGSDDAYISFRYAKNFAYGNGLVFNPGDNVEGYSNLLYTLLITPAFIFTPQFAYPFSIILNLILLGFTLLISFQFLQERFGYQNALLGALLIGINPWIWVHSGTGLETILILFIVTAETIAVEKFLLNKSKNNFILLSVISIASLLSRVDGFILPMMVITFLLLKGHYKFAAKLFIICLVTMILYTTFRYFYYGDIIANTFYNKVSGNVVARIYAGIADFKTQTLRLGLWVPIGFILSYGAWQLWSSFYGWYINSQKNGLLAYFRNIDFASFFIIIWSFYFIYIGGDIYFERFLIPLIPLGIFATWNLFSKYHLKNLWLVGFFLLAISQFYMVKPNMDDRFKYRTNKYDVWSNLGKFLGTNYPNSLLAVDAAGKIPYFSNLKIIDMYGLNEKAIGKMKISSEGFALPGHAKYDAQYVLSKNPDLIATWINPNLNMNTGLDKNVYQPNYRLKYLVNVTRINKDKNNIIDVSGMDEKSIVSLIKNEYSYAVLKRK